MSRIATAVLGAWVATLLFPAYAFAQKPEYGRNSVYLAGLGWQVWGFDPAAAGVALAEKRAKELGLTLHTAAVRDGEYGFGKDKFDLVLFSRFAQARGNRGYGVRAGILRRPQ